MLGVLISGVWAALCFCLVTVFIVVYWTTALLIGVIKTLLSLLISVVCVAIDKIPTALELLWTFLATIVLFVKTVILPALITVFYFLKNVVVSLELWFNTGVGYTLRLVVTTLFLLIDFVINSISFIVVEVFQIFLFFYCSKSDHEICYTWSDMNVDIKPILVVATFLVLVCLLITAISAFWIARCEFKLKFLVAAVQSDERPANLVGDNTEQGSGTRNDHRVWQGSRGVGGVHIRRRRRQPNVSTQCYTSQPARHPSYPSPPPSHYPRSVATPRGVRAQHTHDKRLCIVCTDNECCVLLKPCGHYILCVECFRKLRERLCPVCRKDIVGADAIRIYFA